MAGGLSRLWQTFQTARQLGARQTGWYAVYQAGLRSGLWRWLTPLAENTSLSLPIRSPFPEIKPNDILCVNRPAVISEADEVAGGWVRLFGGPAVELDLTPPGSLFHWTAYETGRAGWGAQDAKTIWEPARFGWAYVLGRAYRLTAREDYPAAFWRYFEAFIHANPPNLGPNWASGQEVALRLVGLVFAARAFTPSKESSPSRLGLLAAAIAAHARRIVPTLSYARAQHNNHLLSEALGLYLAGISLPDHPDASKWETLGWETLCGALPDQIAPDGTYAQYSMNYHRLMLQVALLGTLGGRPYPPKVSARLGAAASWLLSEVDLTSGQTPNYGSNDGAYILPLAGGGFADFRPVVQAAARAFLGKTALPAGPWDELSSWLAQPAAAQADSQSLQTSPGILRLGDAENWAILRAVKYASRPSQADQLHLDLWWKGEAVALDAGTYRYSDPPPWDNALAQTAVHNTIQVDGLNQMRKAGRFLWLDWAVAKVLAASPDRVTAEHDGYHAQGIIHRRTVFLQRKGCWQVKDELLALPTPQPAQPHTFRLHWLLPDWHYQIDEDRIMLRSPNGSQVELRLFADCEQSCPRAFTLVRGGQVMLGADPQAHLHGWYSPTYSLKIPALSFSLSIQALAPITMISEWKLR